MIHSKVSYIWDTRGPHDPGVRLRGYDTLVLDFFKINSVLVYDKTILVYLNRNWGKPHCQSGLTLNSRRF